MAYDEQFAGDDTTSHALEDSVIDFDSIPDKITIEPGPATLEIKEIKSIYSKAKPEEGKIAKKMLVVQTQVVEPSSSSGMLHTIYLVWGTEDDPDARQVETLRKQRGVVDFKQLIIAARVPRTAGQKESDLFLRATGCRFVTEMSEDKGFTRNKGYYPVGHTIISRGPARVTGLKPTLAAPPVVPSQSTIACPSCNEQVARSNFGEHLRSHQEPKVPATFDNLGE